MPYNTQRIRDPLHNIIHFDETLFENVIWELVNSSPFQRLRRVKQLGFSSFVYPGATHTRFAHSIGVFHTARLLMDVIERHLQSTHEWQDVRANEALAASLLHDVGHGPFSHAFEDVGKRLKLPMAHHEKVSKKLILDSELTPILQKMGSGFPKDVANVIDDTVPPTIYSAVVSSQFDADRLDYMRRDRLMCGTDHGAIDFDWLLANIQVGEVSYGVDDEEIEKLKTFVLGPKALFAAESYVHGLFQLYPTVYFHKTTRGAEKLFSELLCQVVVLCRDGKFRDTGLNKGHPLIQFALNPDSLKCAQKLDDEVIFGAFSQMEDAKDILISNFSSRLRKRKFYKAFDIRKQILDVVFKGKADVGEFSEMIDALCVGLEEKVKGWNKTNSKVIPRLLLDSAVRSPYKKLSESKGPLNQILIRTPNNDLRDLRNQSGLVRHLEPFKMCRAYFDKSDEVARNFLLEEIAKMKEGKDYA